eukprot:3614169-Amphidinium_carterae.1
MMFTSTRLSFSTRTPRRDTRRRWQYQPCNLRRRGIRGCRNCWTASGRRRRIRTMLKRTRPSAFVPLVPIFPGNYQLKAIGTSYHSSAVSKWKSPVILQVSTLLRACCLEGVEGGLLGANTPTKTCYLPTPFVQK